MGDSIIEIEDFSIDVIEKYFKILFYMLSSEKTFFKKKMIIFQHL
jgi:hypothetical protein